MAHLNDCRRHSGPEDRIRYRNFRLRSSGSGRLTRAGGSDRRGHRSRAGSCRCRRTYVTSATLRCWLHRCNAVGVDGLGSRPVLGAGSGSPRHSGRPSSPWPTRNRPRDWRATEPGSCRLPMSVRRRSRPGTPGPGGSGCRHRRETQPGAADLAGREDAVAADPQLGYEHRSGVRHPKGPASWSSIPPRRLAPR